MKEYDDIIYTAIKCKNIEDLHYMQRYFLVLDYNWVYSCNNNFQDCSYYFKEHNEYYLMINTEYKIIDAIYEISNSNINKVIDAKIIKRKEKLKRIHE